MMDQIEASILAQRSRQDALAAQSFPALDRDDIRFEIEMPVGFTVSFTPQVRHLNEFFRRCGAAGYMIVPLGPLAPGSPISRFRIVRPEVLRREEDPAYYRKLS